MQFTAQQIATLLQGRLEGDPAATVNNLAKIEEARDGDLCFLSNRKYEEYIYSSAASIIIVNETLQLTAPVNTTLIRVKDAYSSFATLLEHYNNIISGNGKTGVEQPSYVSPKARIGANVYIGAFSYVDDNAVLADGVQICPGSFVGRDVRIGKDSKIYAGVRIYQGCILGNNVIVHSGAIIGGDGFGFAPLSDGSYKKIAQIGNVVIEDDVEIGANTTIDRATMGSTIIRHGVKLDNLIQIAHNVEIGANTVIAAQTGISGSTRIGKNCVIGGQVGIVGHIQIADGTRINAQSGVSKSVTVENTTLNSSPAFDYKSSLKSQAIFRNLPELQNRLLKLEETVQELTALLSIQNTEYKK
ncbi:UDP-3-O-(3-hydroxymyristoyl)glucosamine N-acyltransferase [Nemorincola caseinilytica]|uniref:UDP-3-O-acylglucosamine N-acyltransferase n=1 Tax=Nemorincola caseinilytica TaxID=2054315 RepID=A0ABP8NPQ1_9BACT